MRSILSILFILCATNAYAANLRFLQDSILTEMSKEEITDFKSFVRKALDTLEDNKPVTWKSNSSSMQGKFIAKFSYTNSGSICRRSRFLMLNSEKKEPFQFEICKQGDIWQIQETPAKSFKKSDWVMLRDSIEQALNHKLIGQPYSWHNPKTNNSGSHVVLAEKTIDGSPNRCRDIAISVLDKMGRTANGVYTFCKDNEWKRH